MNLRSLPSNKPFRSYLLLLSLQHSSQHKPRSHHVLSQCMPDIYHSSIALCGYNDITRKYFLPQYRLGSDSIVEMHHDHFEGTYFDHSNHGVVSKIHPPDLKLQLICVHLGGTIVWIWTMGNPSKSRIKKLFYLHFPWLLIVQCIEWLNLFFSFHRL